MASEIYLAKARITRFNPIMPKIQLRFSCPDNEAQVYRLEAHKVGRSLSNYLAAQLREKHSFAITLAIRENLSRIGVSPRKR